MLMSAKDSVAAPWPVPALATPFALATWLGASLIAYVLVRKVFEHISA